MSDVRTQLDAIMDDASRALVAMDYLACESRCVEALRLAREAEEWTYYARILLPLQEARRQRRMIAAEGTLRIGTPDLKDTPLQWLDRMTPGCIVLTPPHTPDQAGQLQQHAREQRAHVEVLFAEPGASAWRLRTFAGRVAECEFRAPPVESMHRWLADPADGRRQDAAEWFIDATEALGDALIAGVGEAEGTRGRIVALESCLDAMTDHEKLHQRLADAARAMRPQPAAAPAAPVAPTPPTSRAVPQRSLSVGRMVRIVVLFLVVFAVLLGVAAYWMWSRTPAHWARHQAWKQRTTVEQRARLAEALEARVAAITRVAGPAERTLEATIEEINAWLDQRARDVLANQNIPVPHEIGEASFSVSGDKPVLAFELTTVEISQVVSLFGRLELRDENTGYFRIVKVLGGDLPIPAGMLTGHVSKSIPEHYLKQVEEYLQGFAGITFEPIVDLDTDRAFRVLSLEMTEEKVTMTGRVEPRR
jgi:hypothetical protein